MTIRPYLPPRRATVPRVTRRGRLPAADSSARLSLAREVVSRDPAINGAQLAAELSISAREGARLLRTLRASGDAPAPAGVAADGRQLARPIVGAAARYRLRPETVARLAEITGIPVGQDVDGQISAVLNLLESAR